MVIYDQTCGSLRLSSKLLGDDVLARVLDTAASLAAQAGEAATLARMELLLRELAAEAQQPAQTPAWALTAPPVPDTDSA